jgi:hypothetical protein
MLGFEWLKAVLEVVSELDSVFVSVLVLDMDPVSVRDVVGDFVGVCEAELVLALDLGLVPVFEMDAV